MQARYHGANHPSTSGVSLNSVAKLLIECVSSSLNKLEAPTAYIQCLCIMAGCFVFVWFGFSIFFSPSSLAPTDTERVPTLALKASRWILAMTGQERSHILLKQPCAHKPLGRSWLGSKFSNL